MIGAILTIGLGAYSNTGFIITLGYATSGTAPVATGGPPYNIAMFPIGMGLNG